MKCETKVTFSKEEEKQLDSFCELFNLQDNTKQMVLEVVQNNPKENLQLRAWVKHAICKLWELYVGSEFRPERDQSEFKEYCDSCMEAYDLTTRKCPGCGKFMSWLEWKGQIVPMSIETTSDKWLKYMEVCRNQSSTEPIDCEELRS